MEKKVEVEEEEEEEEEEEVRRRWRRKRRRRRWRRIRQSHNSSPVVLTGSKGKTISSLIPNFCLKA